MTARESTPFTLDPEALLDLGREAIRLRAAWEVARTTANAANLAYCEASTREVRAGDAHLAGRVLFAAYRRARERCMAALARWEAAADREAEAFDAYASTLTSISGEGGGRLDGTRGIVRPVYGTGSLTVLDDPRFDHLRDATREARSEGR